MNRFLMRLAATAISALMLAGTQPATAQSTPETGNGIDAKTRATLAAIVPDGDDLPVGYSFIGETFLAAGAVAPGEVDAAALTEAGFVTMYISIYQNPDSNTRIRSYVSAWTDEAAAEAGFNLLEDESNAPEGKLTDASVDVGQEPREITTGTYTASDSATVGTADVTFRDQNRLVGVAVETMDGSEADTTLATDLANRMAERAQAVQKGDSPAHTDLALPGRTLSLAGEGTIAQAGFLGPNEVESIYAVQGSVLSGIKASWIETVALEQGGDAPLVTIGLTTFDTPEDAAAAVDQSADIFAPLTNQADVADASVDGADSVKAYQYSSDSAEGDALDSYRIVFATGSDLVVVDVQGVTGDMDAADMANELAAAQVSCQSGDSCTAPELASR